MASPASTTRYVRAVLMFTKKWPPAQREGRWRWGSGRASVAFGASGPSHEKPSEGVVWPPYVPVCYKRFEIVQGPTRAGRLGAKGPWRTKGAHFGREAVGRRSS